jgi:hypothetical protein
MSFNRLIYDNCSYKHQLHENVGTLAYILDPNRYEHSGKCRIELGVLGGTNVSHIQGNLVDLESDLRGTTRHLSKCPEFNYQNPCPQGDMNTCRPKNIVISENPANSGRIINTNLKHLPACQMVHYKHTPLPPTIPSVQCNYKK